MADPKTGHDPKTHRLLHTRDGVESIPREQQGLPLREYLLNQELPKDLENAQVFVTAKGPVAAAPDPVPWAETHTKMADKFVETLKEQIDEKGYYARTLDQFAGRLSQATAYPKDEMKALLVKEFEQTYGKEPYDYLQEARIEQGLPVREAQETDQSFEQED